MASMNNLLISLNYDKVTGSNGSGEFVVVDTISTNLSLIHI